MANELIAPISEDLRQGDNRFDIIKGIEVASQFVKDEILPSPFSCEAGDWLVKGASGLAAPSATAVANTYPVWVGNDQFDSQATGQASIIVGGGGYIYRTSKFVPGSYVAGQNLTVKNLGGGERVPSAASGSDPILARVYTAPDSNNIMEIEVLVR